MNEYQQTQNAFSFSTMIPLPLIPLDHQRIPSQIADLIFSVSGTSSQSPEEISKRGVLWRTLTLPWGIPDFSTISKQICLLRANVTGEIDLNVSN